MKPFQFSIADLLLLMAIVPLWLVLATLIGASSGWGSMSGTTTVLAVFGGMTAALYRIVGERRYGWAIATATAPLLAVGLLALVAVLYYSLA